MLNFNRNIIPLKIKVSSLAVCSSHREYLGEEVGENRQDDKPGAGNEKHPALPAFDIFQVGAHCCYDRHLSGASSECQQDDQGSWKTLLVQGGLYKNAGLLLKSG